MKLGPYFKDAIENANWQKVCNVYEQITGEYIQPPKLKVTLTDIDMSKWENKEVDKQTYNPAEEEMEVEEEAEEEPSAPTQIAQPPPRRPNIADFSIEHHGNGSSGDDKRKRMKKTPMNQLPPMKNRFNDNQKIATDELVTLHPELGVANPRTRGNREAMLEGATDTSKTIAVQCSLCNKKENVSPVLANGFDTDPEENTYKCTTCSTQSGRTKILRQLRNT